MNKWKQFAEMFGLELEEEFNIKSVEDNKIYDDVYKICEGGLLFKSNSEWWRLTGDRELPYDILRGYYEVVKKPWKPKESELYWYIGNSYCIMSKEWSNSNKDIMRWKIGNCFKTSKEALTKGEELIRQIRKEYEND